MGRRSFRRGELLLAALALLEREPMPARELFGRLERLLGDEYRLTPGSTFAALEALEREGLVERMPHGHRTTPGGSVALAERACAEVLQRLGHRNEQVTILFTDVVGSTELFDRHGDHAAHELRRRHFALLRGAVRGHGGREVKNLGDGLMVAFASPPAAVECAH